MKVDFWAHIGVGIPERAQKVDFWGQISTFSKTPYKPQISVKENDFEVEKVWKCLKKAQNANFEI